MSISYKTENGFTTITIAENFDGEVSCKSGKITIIRCGAGEAGSFSCGPAGGGGAVGSNGREGRGIEAGSCGGGGPKWNPYQYKGE